MSILSFLEQLATSTHHDLISRDLIADQSDEAKKALLTSIVDGLKNQFAKDKHFNDHAMIAALPL